MKRRAAVFAAVLGAAAGGALVKIVWLEKYRQQKQELASARMEKDLLYTWLLLEQKRIDLAEYFTAHGFKSIGVMGMGREGRRFFESLKDQEEADVIYAVELDHFSAVHEYLTVYRLGDDPLPEADCIVVCDLTSVSSKCEALRKEFKGEIVTLSEVLAWLIEQHQIKPWEGAIKGWPAEQI